MKILRLTLGFLLLFNSLVYADFTPPANPYDDPPDANTLLQCSFDEADGSTTTDDESATNHTLTANGSVQTDSAQTKFGNTSLFVTANVDYWTIPDHADWTFGSSDFTIDYWVMMPSTDWNGYICGQNQESGVYSWFTIIIPTAIYLHTFNNSADELYMGATSIGTLNFDQWYHIAIGRSVAGNQGYIWIDGVSKTVTLIGGAYNATLINLAGSFYIGSRGYGGTFTGWIDEFRISNVLRTWAAPPSGKQFIMIIEAFNPNLIGSPAWTCKIKVLKWWKNLTWRNYG